MLVLLVLVAVAVSFTVSASAGFGGSLVLVPALGLVLGVKPGIALAALLLAANNIVKVVLYRRTIPYRKAAPVVVLMTVGALAGALLLVAAPERLVVAAVLVTFALAYVNEHVERKSVPRLDPRALALGAGATSGFSGTSGPLKGLAVRRLGLDRQHLVGALSLASLVGDLTKTAVWTEAQLIGADGYRLALAAVPLMLGASLLGRHLNRQLGERGYAGLFWTVMAGYSARLVVGL
jgi:hypothetical protein